MTSRRQDERGVVLVIVLAFVVFVGVLSVAVLRYATNSSQTTARLRPVRSLSYAADGAVEGAINKFRQTPETGLCVGNYYSATALISGVPALINGQAVVVDCAVESTTTVSGSHVVTARFDACPGTGTECPLASRVLSARVQFTGTAPAVDVTVLGWSAKT